MRKKKEGDTLGEKIENYLEKLKKKEVAQLINDAYYEQVYEGGIPFYLRRTNVLRDMSIPKKGKEDEKFTINKTMNIPDEMLLRQNELKKNADLEQKRDRTFDEFFESYADHINGKIDP